MTDDWHDQKIDTILPTHPRWPDYLIQLSKWGCDMLISPLYKYMTGHNWYSNDLATGLLYEYPVFLSSEIIDCQDF